MSAIPYARYRSDMLRLGATDIPTEEEYNRQYGISNDEESAPLQITPKRTTPSSIDADAKNAAEVKERRRKKPSSAKAPTEPKPISTVPKKEKVVKDPKPKLRPRGKHSTLTEEERRELRNARQREYRRQKGTARTYTPEQRDRQREYARQYYEKKKLENPEHMRQKAKEYRQRAKAAGVKSYIPVPPELRKKADFSTMTPEQIEAHKKAKQKESQRRYYMKNKERLLAQSKLHKIKPEYKADQARKVREKRASKRSSEATSKVQKSGMTTTKQCESCAA